MAKITEADIQNTLAYAGLYDRLKKQAIKNILNSVENLITNQIDMPNKLIELISVGLPNVETGDWEKADIEIGDFNGKIEKVLLSKYKTEAKLYVPQRIPLDKFLTSFTSPETLKAFVKKRTDGVIKAIKHEILKAEAKLFTETSNINIGGESIDNIVFDYENTSSTAINSMTDSQVERWLETFKAYVEGLATPSSAHTKETAKAGNETFIGSTEANEITILWNTKLSQRIRTAIAKIYHKNDVLVKIGSHKSVDFEKIAGVDKAKAGKVIAIVRNKNALVRGVFLEATQTIALPKFRMLSETGIEFTFIRIPVYPISIFKSK